MEIQEFVKVFGDQSVSYIVTTVFIIIVYRTWKYMMTNFNNVLNKIIDRLDSLAKSINEHDKSSDQRGQYVRQEHEEMIKILGRINGYKD